MTDFRLLMLGAMYENGGNTTHRFLDGHPELFVYPFESQPGTKLVNDPLSSMFPLKYRWPEFPLAGTPEGDYRLIIDEEGKVRSRTRFVSKFREWPFAMDDEQRKEIYVRIVEEQGRSRGGNVMAFFQATFEAWKDHARTGRESVYVGYSPIIVVDAAKILRDLPGAHVLHVVRNPWAAYADTKKRAVPLSLENYMQAWTFNQQLALLNLRRHPGRLHIVRAEDVMAGARDALNPVLRALAVDEDAASLDAPSWNGKTLDQVYPWGTIRTPTPAANLATANELSAAEQAAVADWAEPFLDLFGYRDFLKDGVAATPRLGVLVSA